jgi:peptidoglycan hydrolase-like protein with peptidoglycan-binding domain
VAMTGAAMSGYLGGGEGGEPAPPPPRPTAKVQRMTLSEGKTVTGSLTYPRAAALVGRLSGTVTKVPAGGRILRAGDALYEVDNRRVVLMTGKVPAYRALAPGARGPDVRQLEDNLRALGYSGFTVDDEYSGATADAVRRWQKDNRLTRTGTVELGRVVFRPGPLRVGTHKVEIGTPIAAGPVYETTGTERHASLRLGREDHRLAVVGARAVVVLPDGRTTPGTVTEVGTPTGDGADAKVPVVVKVTDRHALDRVKSETIDVRLVARERRNVLAAPIVALLAVGDSGYGVEVKTGPATRIVEVRLGLFADGKVELTGAGIAEGTDVVVPAT